MTDPHEARRRHVIAHVRFAQYYTLLPPHQQRLVDADELTVDWTDTEVEMSESEDRESDDQSQIATIASINSETWEYWEDDDAEQEDDEYVFNLMYDTMDERVTRS